MVAKADLIVEAAAGAAAAVAVALLAEEAGAVRRFGRRRVGRPEQDGQPRGWVGQRAQGIALHLAFLGVMAATRTLARRWR